MATALESECGISVSWSTIQTVVTDLQTAPPEADARGLKAVSATVDMLKSYMALPPRAPDKA